MNLKKCILTANDCYKKGEKMTGGKPVGIVVHSTGANNKELRRYVQPLETDADYNTIIADIGKNAYGNHWNQSSAEMGRQVCVHAFIGENAKGSIETYQTLPFDMCCWGCGSGSKGSYNKNPQAHIQFEICEDALESETYFNAIFKEAIEFCAYLCKTYGISTSKIRSHKESHADGYGSNHADCDHWLKKFGKDMNWFRTEVEKLLVEPAKTTYYVQTGAYLTLKNATKHLEKVKAAGFDAIIKKSGLYYKVQTGAFSNRSYADAMAEKLMEAGFSIYVTTKGGTIVSTKADTIEVGDKVKIKEGVTTFSNGKKMASWVSNATLYVRKIEDNGTVMLVSTEPTKNVYTGRVKATDVYKI